VCWLHWSSLASSAVVSASLTMLLNSPWGFSPVSMVFCMFTMWPMAGFRRGPFALVLMRTMLGMSSWASTTPLARHARKARLWPWWGLASSMPRPQTQSRALRSRPYSARLMCRLVARTDARVVLKTSRSDPMSKEAMANGDGRWER